MFHSIKDGYDKTLGGYVDIASNLKWYLAIDGAGHGDFIEVMGLQRYTEVLRSFQDNSFIQMEQCR